MRDTIRDLYNLIPLKKQVYKGIRAIWTPPKSVYKHLHFKSKFKIELDDRHSFYINNNNSEIENDIFWEGLENCWEKVSLKLWIELCKEANVVFDVGAYTGMYSLVAKCMNPDAKVYTFEPTDRLYRNTVENAKINNYNINVEHLGVSSSNGKVEIEGIYQENKFVDSVALDNYIADNGIHRLDLIKIDVEKHEPQVLEGFKKSLEKFQPTLLIESLTDDIGKQIQSYLEKYDYLYFNIDEDAGVRQTNEIRKSDYYNYLVCKSDVAQKLGLL